MCISKHHNQSYLNLKYKVNVYLTIQRKWTIPLILREHCIDFHLTQPESHDTYPFCKSLLCLHLHDLILQTNLKETKNYSSQLKLFSVSYNRLKIKLCFYLFILFDDEFYSSFIYYLVNKSLFWYVETIILMICKDDAWTNYIENNS